MLEVFKYTNNLISPLGLNKDIWIWKSNLNFNFKEITKYLINKEEYLIKKFPAASDGNTNLPNSVTARNPFFNLFSFEDSNELNKVKKFIKLNVKEMLNKFNLNNLKDLYIICWFNVLRKGESIGKHTHYSLKRSHESFISGHFCINAFNTSTFYNDISEQTILEIKNEIGQLTMFPSYLPHWSNKHNGEEPRISIAFDIFPEKKFAWNHYVDTKTAIQFNLE